MTMTLRCFTLIRYVEQGEATSSWRCDLRIWSHQFKCMANLHWIFNFELFSASIKIHFNEGPKLEGRSTRRRTKLSYEKKVSLVFISIWWGFIFSFSYEWIKKVPFILKRRRRTKGAFSDLYNYFLSTIFAIVVFLLHKFYEPFSSTFPSSMHEDSLGLGELSELKSKRMGI